MITNILVILAAYLLGSIPTAFIAGRITNGDDIRKIGDGNMGAQNAYRELGRRTGIVVGVIDGMKGALAVLIAQAAGVPLLIVFGAGLAALAGHNWPAYIGFRGGRGVATSLGVLLVLMPLPVLVVAGPALAILFLRKSVILTSSIIFLTAPVVGLMMGYPLTLLAYSLVLPIIVGLTHWFRTRRWQESAGALSPR